MSYTSTVGGTKTAVLVAVSIITRSPSMSELELVAALESEGFSHLHAEKLCAFVPSARMGVESFPSHYLAADALGRAVRLPVAEEHYFTSALQLATETLDD